MQFDAGPAISIRVVQLVVDELVDAGVDPDRLLGDVGLSRRDLGDPDSRVPIDPVQLFDAAVQLTGDEAFGLRVAERIRPGSFGVVDYLLRNSGSVMESLTRASQYQRLVHEGELTLEQGDELAIVRHSLPGGLQLSGAAAECMIGTIAVMARQVASGTDPCKVYFVHSAPKNLRQHAALFRAPVQFESKFNGLAFRSAHLSRPLPNADSNLCAILEEHASQLLEQLPNTREIRHYVMRLMTEELAKGRPTEDCTAARMRISPRTLRRRLLDAGTSHQQLLDEVRYQLAVRYLKDRRLDILDVALLLGFSEPGGFHRAFKRWTETTPAEYRRRIL